jgi:hypothetical protein
LMCPPPRGAAAVWPESTVHGAPFHSTTSLMPPSVIWYIASCSARHGESVILPMRVSPFPLRSEMRVSDACASTCPPTAFFASGTNLSRVGRERSGRGLARWLGAAAAGGGGTGWSGGAVRSHCAGVSTDLVGQDDRKVELRGEAARRVARRGRSGTWARDAMGMETR